MLALFIGSVLLSTQVKMKRLKFVTVSILFKIKNIWRVCALVVLLLSASSNMALAQADRTDSDIGNKKQFRVMFNYVDGQGFTAMTTSLPFTYRKSIFVRIKLFLEGALE